MIFPSFLKPGDTIAITCPSGYLPKSHAQKAVETMEAWGFKVIVGETVGGAFHYFSGEDHQRKSELQFFLDNPQVNAIMAGRGGYGLSRIIDELDFTEFKKHPKWVIGFSDITVLHDQIQTRCGIASIHGPMCHAFMDAEFPLRAPHLETLRSLITGTPIHYVVEGDEHNRPGSGVGELVGGNLTLLAHLCGSVSQPVTKGKILFIEDVGEYIYAIDRKLLTLKRAGLFDGLSGLICGAFSEIKDTERPFGSTIEEIVLEKVSGYDFPVCFGFSAGHIQDNFPVILGGKHKMQVEKDLVKIKRVEAPEA